MFWVQIPFDTWQIIPHVEQEGMGLKYRGRSFDNVPF